MIFKLHLEFVKTILPKIAIILFAALLTTFAFRWRNSKNSPNENNISPNDSLPKNVSSIYFFPEKLDFAGENVPLENFDVVEDLDREILANMYWQSRTLLFIKRANRYFPIIEPILKKNNIPDDFKYLAIAESGLANVGSPAGARGFWQFMKATAKEFKLEVNDFVDERYHLEKATQAACQYFKNAYSKFKSWTLVAASYNAGMSYISQQIRRQGTNNFYNLLLVDETNRYIYQILSTKLMMQFPEKYNFSLKKTDLYTPIPTKKVKVDFAITDLVNFARKQNVHYKILKSLNPWLRDNSLPNASKKVYYIELPVENYRKTEYLPVDTTEKK